MVGIYSGSERLFYPMAGGKWKFGPPENAKLLRKLGGHEDIAVAMRSPNQCVLRYLMGFDNNALMPMYVCRQRLWDGYRPGLRESFCSS